MVNDAVPALAVALALLTAVANASALVLQRKAAQDTQDSRRRDGAGTVTLQAVARHPAWIAGLAIFTCGVGIQATALTFGSIALVQPVLVLVLPLTLMLGSIVLGGPLRRFEWACVAVMSVGVVTLLVSLQPHGGDALGADTGTWVAGAAVTLGVMAGCGVVAARSGPTVRATLFGVAAGMGSGFVAVIVKAMSDALVAGGVTELLLTWQTYLLLPGAPAAFLFLQQALRTGRLLASQPGVVLANPLLASFWGVALLGEQVRGGFGILGGAVGAVLLTVGVVLLARSALLDEQGSDRRAALADGTGTRS